MSPTTRTAPTIVPRAATGYNPSRREVLKGAAVGTGILALAGEAKAAPSRIIDTHIHLYDPSRPQGVPWPPKDNTLLYRTTLPADFKAATKGLGITGVVVVEASAWLDDNQWILDLAKDNPLIMGFVGHLEPGDSFPEHVARFGKDPLFRGIRLGSRLIGSGLARPGFLDNMKMLADRDLQLDAIGNYTMYREVIKLNDQVPRLRIVMDHLPLDPIKDAEARKKAESDLRELAHRPNVYAKVSGVLRPVEEHVPVELSRYRELLDHLWDTFGRDRVVYGSNWPVSNRLAPYPEVLRIVREYFTAKGTEAAERYFWKNSLAAYKWVGRA